MSLGSADRCEIFVAPQSLGNSKDSASLLFWDAGPGILGSTLRRHRRKCLKAKASLTRRAMLADCSHESRTEGKRLTIAGMKIRNSVHVALCRPNSHNHSWKEAEV